MLLYLVALPDYTKDNRDKRKAPQERRSILAKQMQALSMAMQEGQRGLNELHHRIEANLQQAKHAETGQWKQEQSSVDESQTVEADQGVSRVVTFEDVWDDIQRRLLKGIEIPNWSYDGRTRGTTRVDEIYYYEIWVNGSNTTESRTVRREDFKKMYEIWELYKLGHIRRGEISGLSRNSTYIFTILHWRETDQETAG